MPLLDPVGDESVLDRAAVVAQRHLAVDAVYIAELSRSESLIRAFAGDGTGLDVTVGNRRPREQTYAHLLATGHVPELARNVAAEAAGATSLDTQGSRVATCLGAPLRYGNGELFGAICALSMTPDPTLDDRDVRFLELLGDLLTPHLDELRDLHESRGRLTTLLAERELAIAAQPIVSLRDGACLGIEALARFPSDLGAPADVFAQATALGLDIELERLAVQQAWPLLELLEPEQFLTVNVSPSVAAVLAERATAHAELPLHQLVIEITEHSAISGYAPLREVLRPLRKAGLRVAIDDAGAGYASLRHVVELRPDFIKIDRDLVHGVAQDHARRVAVSAFVLLALDLDATVVAEGLERPDDLAALVDLGVDAAQGYLLGKPVVDRTGIRAGLAGRISEVP